MDVGNNVVEDHILQTTQKRGGDSVKPKQPPSFDLLVSSSLLLSSDSTNDGLSRVPTNILHRLLSAGHGQKRYFFLVLSFMYLCVVHLVDPLL